MIYAHSLRNQILPLVLNGSNQDYSALITLVSQLKGPWSQNTSLILSEYCHVRIKIMPLLTHTVHNLVIRETWKGGSLPAALSHCPYDVTGTIVLFAVRAAGLKLQGVPRQFHLHSVWTEICFQGPNAYRRFSLAVLRRMPRRVSTLIGLISWEPCTIHSTARSLGNEL